MDTIQQINSRFFPNALAKLRVSVKDRSIENIELPNSTKAPQMQERKPLEDRKKLPEVDEIWRNLGLGKIDISYACCGYTLDGRPILNQDDFINLLINYGFTMQAIMPFIEDFAEQSMQLDTAPIVMYSVNTAKILSDIGPITRKK